MEGPKKARSHRGQMKQIHQKFVLVDNPKSVTDSATVQVLISLHTVTLQRIFSSFVQDR